MYTYIYIGKSDSEDEAGVLKGTELSHRLPVATYSSNGFCFCVCVYVCVHVCVCVCVCVW